MNELTIGQVASRTGLSTSAIRYYEAEGLVAPAARGLNGYRLFSEADIRRLILTRQARQLGLPLSEVRSLITEGFNADCETFGSELAARIVAHRTAVIARIAELRALEASLGALETHLKSCVCPPGMAAVDCPSCLISHEGGDR